MSWQAYVDSSLLGTGKIDRAGIYSRAGDSTWATSANLSLSAAELQAIAKAFENPSNVFSSGILIQGEKYFGLKADERSVYGKKGNKGICCVRTKMAIVIGHYPESTVPGEASKIVEGLADYLIAAGY